MNHPFDVDDIAATYANKSPSDILKLAFQHFGDDLWISFSGAEDVVLVDMAWKLNKNVNVFSLDTGRLHPETYRFIDQVREQYKIDIDIGQGKRLVQLLPRRPWRMLRDTQD
jgi:phosphoadenosine phosphosulfate reductase